MTIINIILINNFNNCYFKFKKFKVTIIKIIAFFL